MAGRAAGAGLALGLAVLAASAGQPIEFSSPYKELDAPSRKEVIPDLPRLPFRFEFRGPSESMPSLPPVLPMDPQLEKKLREQREQNKNWLMQEPAIFKDRFSDPFKKDTSAGMQTFKSWDNTAERVLGKPEGEDGARKDPRLFGSPVFSDKPLFEVDRRVTGRGEPAIARRAGDREEAEPNSLRPSSESVVRGLFEPRSSTDRLLAAPGMSFSEIFEAARAKTEKRDREARREEFNRLLSPPAPMAGNLTDPVLSPNDLTRQPVNPILPLGGPASAGMRSPLDLPTGLNPTEKLNHPKLPYDDVIARYQTLPPPAAKQDAKARQMESLRLTTRPSVLSFPGRPF
jgi:hypothetical protein